MVRRMSLRRQWHPRMLDPLVCRTTHHGLRPDRRRARGNPVRHWAGLRCRDLSPHRPSDVHSRAGKGAGRRACRLGRAMPAGTHALARLGGRAPAGVGIHRASVASEIPAAPHGTAVQSGILPTPRGRIAALLICVGFFAAFVVGMHPKSAHLPWLVEGVTYVGTLSSRSLIYLLVYEFLLALFAFGFGRRSKLGSSMPALVALVLVYAVMFFTLPFMKELGVASGLNNALSLLFLTLSIPLLASTPPHFAARGATCLTAGALCAALAAAVFMGPLFNVLPHQDEVFVALPFVVNLAVLVLGVTLGPWLRGFSPKKAKKVWCSKGLLTKRPRSPRTTASRWPRRGGSPPAKPRSSNLSYRGATSPDMREHLCISRATVETHVNHIYKKAGVLSRQESPG